MATVAIDHALCKVAIATKTFLYEMPIMKIPTRTMQICGIHVHTSSLLPDKDFDISEISTGIVCDATSIFLF